jgi:hypothetical protein
MSYGINNKNNILVTPNQIKSYFRSLEENSIAGTIPESIEKLSALQQL